MKTQIFSSKAEFDLREDKTVNGVSQNFLDFMKFDLDKAVEQNTWLVAALLHLTNQRQSSTFKRINDSLDRTVDNCIDFNKQVRLLNSQVKKW